MKNDIITQFISICHQYIYFSIQLHYTIERQKKKRHKSLLRYVTDGIVLSNKKSCNKIGFRLYEICKNRKKKE